MTLPAVRHLQLPTGPLAYRRGGEGPPVMLIHGWGGSSRYWLGAYFTLSERHDVIALDLPGYGDSPPPRGPATLADLTRLAFAAADALALSTLAVAGHSLGASVALMMAATSPERITRLALTSFGLPRSPEEEALFAGLHIALRANATLWTPWLSLWQPWLALARPWTQMLWMTPPWPLLFAGQVVHSLNELSYATLALGAADLAAMDARVALESASNTGDPTIGAAARQVRAPTLVLSGREDPIFPPSAVAALAQALPDAGLVLLDRCGHVPMAERPAPFYSTLGAFFAP